VRAEGEIFKISKKSPQIRKNKQKYVFIAVYLKIMLIFAKHYGRNAIFARHIETTKRYARLANGNVGNFQ